MVAMRDIRAFSDAIAWEFKPAKTILLGSHAWGRPTKDSDVDLLVVMPQRGLAVDKGIEIRRSIRRGFPLDLLVRSPSEVDRRLRMEDAFIGEIVSRGRVLYEARDQGVGRVVDGSPGSPGRPWAQQPEGVKIED